MIFKQALEYRAAGISIIPLKCNGSKSPAVPTWKKYQAELADEWLIQTWFGNSKREVGAGAVCGVVSGGTEVLDFDNDANTIYPAWSESVTDILRRLPVVKTPSDGYHVYYRCNTICGNQKIAKGAGNETLIESRGEGGYVVATISSPTVHETGKPYVQVAGPVLPEIPRITPDERQALWAAAATFDRSREREKAIQKLIAKSKPRPPKSTDGKLTPWDDFNSRGDWFEVLDRHGWTTTDGIHWRHPAAKSGHSHSATLRTAKSGDQILHVFTTSTELDSEKSHSLFNVVKILDFGGDASATTRELRKQGYGN